MLELGRRSYDFARYTYRGMNEVTMGYEYENTDTRRLRWTARDEELKDQLKKATIALLPNHFRVEYEGFGHANGCEIKSVVAPLFLHKQFWNRYVSKLPFHMAENSSTNDSGIHVSISRTPFTEAGKTKVFTFLHDPENREVFFRLSKRTVHSFNVNAPSNPRGQPRRTWNDAMRRYNPDEWPTNPEWPDHYNMINTENPERFEFRVFAAHPTLLLPALEMCDSLFKMAPDYEVITVAGWRDYIACFKKYEHIKEHCIATLDRSPS